MDLSLAAAKLFPGENVSPTFESYDAMNANWRGSSPCPSEQEFTDAFTIADAEMFQTKRDIEYLKQGITDKAKNAALWDAFMNAKSTVANDLKIKIDAIDAAFPEPK